MPNKERWGSNKAKVKAVGPNIAAGSEQIKLERLLRVSSTENWKKVMMIFDQARNDKRGIVEVSKEPVFDEIFGATTDPVDKMLDNMMDRQALEPHSEMLLAKLLDKFPGKEVDRALEACLAMPFTQKGEMWGLDGETVIVNSIQILLHSQDLESGLERLKKIKSARIDIRTVVPNLA